ncbi:arylamine N-acetyltransferase [Burkholderia sp. Ac-20353]|uniref:arylamine N-acetyltransferase family protein n=1 Tax=Burkholderia sp. Ac-20353 TaxID=2703894 RepID=UPI00197B9531|nr:arylamine N-acetyltransferase [Burkholderia sp. Ac-20353]MBN3786636.1 arylamine N-acetyltransferase [Burkholderia sp. Ac-20353]
MDAENFTLQHYFDRIGFEQPAAADIATVAEMMRRQLFTVPFENLDVQEKRGVSLVPEEIVEKILHRKRGGYCYEVNGIFAMALQALGVSYQFVAARPMFYPVKRPKTHMALVLNMNGERWLCDLGFGSYGIRAPMRLDEIDIEVKQDADTFMLSMTSDREYLLKALVDGQWANQYAFDLSPQEWIDFAPANYLNSTHPDAVFVQKMLVVLHNEAGRKILFGDTLKAVVNGQTEQYTISPDDRGAILFREFGLTTTHN